MVKAKMSVIAPDFKINKMAAETRGKSKMAAITQLVFYLRDLWYTTSDQARDTRLEVTERIRIVSLR